MDVVNEDVAVAAGQLSQADIIERQADAIARLKRQVRKGDEYKQLTKSKLKEAAARLKEYRLRVETLHRELQEEQEKAKKQLKHAAVKAKKQVKDASSQTDKTLTLTRACQTQLSGAVQRVNKKTLVDNGVQTVDTLVDNGASRKRGREHASTSTQTETDQLVPRLSRDLKDVDTQVLMEDTADGQTAAMWTSSEPLQLQVPMLGASDSAFPHETSAALDAELAFSDSDDGEAGAVQEEAAVDIKSSAGLVGSFDPTVLDEIDQELASSSDEDDGGACAVQEEAAVERKSSAGLVGSFDPAVLDEIDQELASSSDEDDGGGENSNQEEEEERGKRTLMSIDDELDDEFAALDSDSEPEHQEKKHVGGNKEDVDSSSSSDSSDSDSSDSSDSDSDGDADDPMTSIPSSKRPTPMVSPTIPNKPTPSADSTDSTTTTSAGLSLHSAVISMVETVEPADEEDSEGSQSLPDAQTSGVISEGSQSLPDAQTSGVISEGSHSLPDAQTSGVVSEGSHSLPDAQTSGVVSPTKGVAVGKARKAEEANLDDTQGATQKKIKLGGGVSAQVGGVMQERNPHAIATAESKKAEKKPASRSESKEEVRMKKSLAAFTKAIILSTGEEADKDYARRTIALLVNQSSKFVDTNLAHVKTLCQVLADSYRELGVFPMVVLRGTLGIFRAPRSRRLMLDRKLGLSWLCHELLLKVMRTSDEASNASGLLCLSLVEECLQHLRGFLVEERTNIGDSMSSSKIQVQVATRQISVSHDKVFLAHICALHTHLCKSTGQLARSRVLLFDLLRGNPNIRGLYFAAYMVEIYPAMLERSFDQHCVERHDTLKETLLQVLIAIGCVAAERQELVLHQSSHTMLNRIADAIQMREIEVIDGADPKFSRTWVQTLYDKLSASCRPFNPETATATEYYELAKSLEICTAVFGLDVVAQIFSIDRCQKLFSRATLEAKVGVISVVSHIALAAAAKTSDTQDSRTRSENTIDWLHQVLVETNNDETSTDDRFKLLAQCAAECVEVVLGYSAADGLDMRRRGLCAVVRWFEAVPPDQLVGLPAAFLRRLRLAVVAARPQMVRAAV
ncbi:hypothetical protein PF004_g10929 [Phytophthora fragariae]|uniref:Uncharacterized protein n=1 Tax=Phytophthora fragariae TaxID=53985 RepID=A0A6G0NZJ6_9STRA|nr:hypothetical protein PF004_g10929 [Phytophthora fragariae]